MWPSNQAAKASIGILSVVNRRSGASQEAGALTLIITGVIFVALQVT